MNSSPAPASPGAFSFMGLRFHNLDLNGALKKLEEFMREKKPRAVFTPTAELIVRAQKDGFLKKVYNSADILTVDGYVVYYAARLCGKPMREPVSAARLMFSFLDTAHKKNYRLYLLGAGEDVVRQVVQNLQERYPGIAIAGWHNGYFDFEHDEHIVNDIRQAKPDVLFVAMSSPLKERFITKNAAAMSVPVSMGVGGSFDIIAGKCRLAPPWISKMGLEWLYRLVQEPRRLFRRYLVTNSRFLLLLAQEMIKIKK